MPSNMPGDTKMSKTRGVCPREAHSLTVSFVPLSLPILATPAQITLSSEKSRTMLSIQSICWSYVGTGAHKSMSLLLLPSGRVPWGAVYGCPGGSHGIGSQFQQQQLQLGSQYQLLPAPSLLLPGITSQMSDLRSWLLRRLCFQRRRLRPRLSAQYSP